MTRMIRPCSITYPVVVNAGTPFCAYTSFVGIAEQDEFWEVFIDLGGLNRANESSSYYHVYAIADTEEEANAIMRILEWQLAKALNPPIKVTQAVLDAMEKVPDAEFLLVLDDYLPFTERTPRRRTTPLFFNDHSENVCWYGYPDGDVYNIERVASDGYEAYIQASDGCPLALQVLLQFNEEGELIDVRPNNCE